LFPYINTPKPYNPARRKAVRLAHYLPTKQALRPHTTVNIGRSGSSYHERSPKQEKDGAQCNSAED